ncbi:MAG: Hsp20/alpha crystallin family protein [Chloroflexota bacterium]
MHPKQPGGDVLESFSGSGQLQQIPVNVYETDQDVIIVAPMPGVEAENIAIEVDGSEVRLEAPVRGPGQAGRRYLFHEWSYGGYRRTVQLPLEVDAKHGNASHSNGVLVVSLPKGVSSGSAKIRLEQRGTSESDHRGHFGHHSLRGGLPGGELND